MALLLGSNLLATSAILPAGRLVSYTETVAIAQPLISTAVIAQPALAIAQPALLGSTALLGSSLLW